MTKKGPNFNYIRPSMNIISLKSMYVYKHEKERVHLVKEKMVIFVEAHTHTDI